MASRTDLLLVDWSPHTMICGRAMYRVSPREQRLYMISSRSRWSCDCSSTAIRDSLRMNAQWLVRDSLCLPILSKDSREGFHVIGG